MNLENKIIENIDIDRAYDKAIKFIKEESIDPNTFKDLYGAKIIENDLEYVRNMESRFSQNGGNIRSKKLATVFEVIFTLNAELNNWLGENSFTYKTSRYDDIKNGVDVVAEFIYEDEAYSHLAIAVDVTVSDDLTKKFRKIKKEIEKGELAKIKYFVSDNIGMKGKLYKIPRIVVGADSGTVSELSELWLNGDNKNLSEHFVQFQILEEIVMQLERFVKFAEQLGKNEIANIYRRQMGIVKRIISEKSELYRKVDRGERDTTFLAIKYCVDNFGEI